MSVVTLKGKQKMDKKRLSISSKRQITIPQKYFMELGFENEAECFVRNDELVIRPVALDDTGEFAEQILTDLIKDGYTGEELLQEFKKARKQIRPAIQLMKEDALKVAEGELDYESLEDVFGSED